MRHALVAVVSCVLLLVAASPARAQDGEASPSMIPVVVGVAGVAFLGLGVFFSLQASGAEDDAMSATEHAMALEHADSARSATNTANLLYLFGASLLAVGVGWFSIELTDAEDANETALSIGPGSLALHGTFDAL